MFGVWLIAGYLAGGPDFMRTIQLLEKTKKLRECGKLALGKRWEAYGKEDYIEFPAKRRLVNGDSVYFHAIAFRENFARGQQTAVRGLPVRGKFQTNFPARQTAH